jgi:3-hydroxyisobutyrate dehydrogenase-like beta-hydroxyacid dehydrogenase
MANSTTADVTVLGCGLMGSALARALARAGKSVVVWNRTPAKAEALVAPNICAAASLDEAASAAPLVLACLGTYDDVKSTLAGAWLEPGTTVVNIASGGPDQAVDLQKWTNDQGLGYLDGVIWAYPDDIDASVGQIAFSGPMDLWDRHAEMLTTLAGEVFHISDDVFTGNVLDVGVVGAFYVSALTALVESASYIAEYGISSDSALAVLRQVIDLLAQQADEAIQSIKSGSFESDQATVSVYAAGARATRDAMRANGQAARLIGAASAALDSATGAGLGDLGIFALHKISGHAPAHT